MKTPKKSDPLTSVRKKLKLCDPEIQNYVEALEKENVKLHKEIAKLKVENMSLNNRVKATIEEVDDTGTKKLSKILNLACESNEKGID
jgi:predicted nuclease with TOPRIM domain